MFHEDLPLIEALTPRIITSAFLWLLLLVPITAQSPNAEIQILSANQALKRAIKSGEKHTFKISLDVDEYLHVEVEQHNVDVAILLTDPASMPVAHRSRPTGMYGNESLSFVATKRGEYRLDIEALTWISVNGEYKLEVKLRRPTLQDRTRSKAESLFEEGNKLDRPNEVESLRGACKKYEAAIVLWQSVTDPYGEAVMLSTLGRCKGNLNKPAEAIKPYERALTIYQQLDIHKQLDDPFAIGRTHWLLGLLNNEAGNPQSALEHYTLSLPLFAQTGEINREVETLGAIGSIYLSLGKYLESIDSYKKVLSKLRAIPGKSRDEAAVLHNIGISYSFVNDNVKALDCLNEALNLNRSINDREGVITTLISIARIYLSSHQKQRAFPLFDEALDLRREGKNNQSTAETLNVIGITLASNDSDRAAVRYFKEALGLWRAIPHAKGEAAALTFIGVSYVRLGETEEALKHFALAQPIFQKNHDEPARLGNLVNLGKAYLTLDRYDQALECAEEARNLGETLKDIRGQIRAEYLTGAILVTTVNPKVGLEHYKRALNLYGQLEKTAEDKLEEAEILVSVGIVQSSLDDDPGALKNYNKALIIFRETKNRMDEAQTLSSIAKVHSRQRDFPKALELFNQALSINQKYGFGSQESSNLLNIGLVYLDLGEKVKALEFYNKALLSSSLVEHKQVQVASLIDLMVDLKELGDPSLAIFYGKQSINIVQELRRNLQQTKGDPHRAFLKNVDNMYANLAVLLIEQSRFEEAHQALNAYKDQAYFDLDLKRIKKPESLRMTPREEYWSSQYSEALARIRAIHREREKLELGIGSRPFNADETANLQKIEERLARAKDEFLDLFNKARSAFKVPSDPRQDVISGIEDTRKMQQALSEIEPKTVAIYTILGGYNYQALIITPEELISITAPIKRRELNIKALQLWALLQTDEYDPRILSKEIYNLLFKPIKDELIKRKKLDDVLPEGATILWSLEDNLRYLPMSALYDGEKYLLERYNNVVFTRAEVEKWLHVNSGKWTGLGFGSSRAAKVNKSPYHFPAIPNSIKELNVVFNGANSPRGIFRGKIFPEQEFTKENMIAALQQSDPHPLVHITSHFYFSPGDQSNSYLLLGNESTFALSEMKAYPDLFKGVDLLTLSACETAAQRPNSDGREVDGFAELAQRQGAAAVIATLWNVTADSTYLLMNKFYEMKSNTKGLTKAEALRQAQLNLMTRPIEESVGFTQRSRFPTKGRGNSTSIRIVPVGKEYPQKTDEGTVWVEARYAKSYTRTSNIYAHPYYWSPFILFGNWR